MVDRDDGVIQYAAAESGENKETMGCLWLLVEEVATAAILVALVEVRVRSRLKVRSSSVGDKP